MGVSAWIILFDSRFDSKYFVTSYSREGRGFPFLIKSKSIWRFRKVSKQVDCWEFKHRQCISWLKIETQKIHIIVVSREEDILLPLVIHPWSPKLIHGYLWVVTWIFQSCYLDVFKFFFSASQLLFTPGAQCHFSPPAVRGKTKRHHKEMLVRLEEYFELTCANSALPKGGRPKIGYKDQDFDDPYRWEVWERDSALTLNFRQAE